MTMVEVPGPFITQHLSSLSLGDLPQIAEHPVAWDSVFTLPTASAFRWQRMPSMWTIQHKVWVALVREQQLQSRLPCLSSTGFLLDLFQNLFQGDWVVFQYLCGWEDCEVPQSPWIVDGKKFGAKRRSHRGSAKWLNFEWKKTKEYLKDYESYLDYSSYLDDDFHPSYMDNDFRESDGFYCACPIRWLQ